jgi:hypothetical protein
MAQDALVFTVDAAEYQQARMLLEVSSVLGIDDAIDPARLVDELIRRGWQVGINQERPVELPADYVVALRDDARHGFWADSVDVGLVLALAAALRDDDRLRPRHDDGGLIS